jgi:hypothetical protein
MEDIHTCGELQILAAERLMVVQSFHVLSAAEVHHK